MGTGSTNELEDTCDDRKLIAAARQGDQRAFTRLVECNQDRLFAAMGGFLGHHADAQDAVQEAFVRAFQRIDTFNHDSKFSTWLYRIAFNAAVSNKRKRRPTASLDQRHDEFGLETVDDSDGHVSDALIGAEERRLLYQALDALSDDHRAILVLRELDDLAYEEIASILGIKVGTVRSRLARARSRLRDAADSLAESVHHQNHD